MRRTGRECGCGLEVGVGQRRRGRGHEFEEVPLRLLTMDGACASTDVGGDVDVDGYWMKVEEGHEHPVLEGMCCA